MRGYDWRELCEKLGLGGASFPSSENMRCFCPFLHRKAGLGNYYDKVKKSFSINIATGQWYCWSCQSRGTSLQSLMYALSRPEGMCYRRELPDAPPAERAGSHLLPQLTANRQIADNYLKGRGIHAGGWLDVMSVGASDDGTCIYFPLISSSGRFEGFLQKNVRENSWMPPFGVDRGGLIYGPPIRPGKRRRLWATESVMDVFMLLSWGEIAAATCGASVTEEQAERLLERGEEILCVKHNDSAGARWLESISKRLRGRCVLRSIKVPEYRPSTGEVLSDVADMNKFEFLVAGRKVETFSRTINL